MPGALQSSTKNVFSRSLKNSAVHEKELLRKNIPVEEEKTASPSIDRSKLTDFKKLQVSGKPDILEQIITTYFRSSDPLLDSLRDAVTNDDFETLQNTAHTFKSSSAIVGAMKLAELSNKLELDCRKNTLQNPA